MTEAPDPRSEALIQAWLDGSIDEAEAADLQARLQAAPGLAEALLRQLRTDSLLRHAVRKTLPDLSPQRRLVVRPGTMSARRSAARRRPVRSWGGFIAAGAALAAGLVLAVLLVGLPERTPDRGGVVARLQVEAGQVRMAGAGGEAAVQDAADLRAGDRIIVGADARAAIVADAGATVLALAAGSEATVADASAGLHLRLKAGAIEARVAHQAADAPLRISTALAEARVLGTRFTIDVRDGSRLAVAEGLVRFTRLADQAAIDVPAGAACRIAGGSAPLALEVAAAAAAPPRPRLVRLVSSPGPDTANDQRMAQRLESLGMRVEVATSPGQLATWDGIDLVLISKSVGKRLKPSLDGLAARAIPVLCCEHGLYPDLGLTDGEGHASADAVDRLAVDPAAGLSAGLAGEVAVCAPTAVSWGRPGRQAIVVARLPGRSDAAAVFAYEAGAALATGTAPARRMGFFLPHDAQPTAEGWRLFDAAVRWCLAMEPAAR